MTELFVSIALGLVLSYILFSDWGVREWEERLARGKQEERQEPQDLHSCCVRN